ncbi:Coenzyme F420 hydrogenase/dehydrogenase, beta subunit C-terminal domain [Arthrobacter rhombi]|uniref:Coenzyme F420 hydrogenase/dehydrogenase, beta subunit C-terminal domain n=1 Tax=Arthrobacter rhombi TaxID=71253 RepID=UPI000BB75946|nr:hypothetical protein CIK75_04505 [Glutamicibacter sp. BW78]
MSMNTAGFLRPRRTSAGQAPPGAAKVFKQSCPGMTVRSNDDPDLKRHETMGSFVGVWSGHAIEAETRYRGSSAGVLTALTTWLLESGQTTRVAGARAGDDPRRTVPVTITTKEEALASSGSRYAPVATLDNCDILAQGTAVVGKPCEVSALRAFHGVASKTEASSPTPLMLSFFCAGTPSSHATEALIARLGFPAGEIPKALWYRGRGWPGRFSATLRGTTRSMSYDESWGDVLGPATQWRCKVCPDGVGESADIAVADYWQSDASGYPMFVEADGSSAIIARTIRGRETLLRAAKAGIIALEPIKINSLADVQPFQVQRRKTLLPRLVGSLLAGRLIPKYTGFRLTKLARERPRIFVRVARGTVRRIRTRAK